MALVDDIMAYESGEMDAEREQAFFEHIAKSGLWRQLQGHYGRACAARGLI